MIHLNIGSNLNSNFGSRFDNITIAINLLVSAKIKIKKISNFYETPSYPNKRFPNYLNVGVLCSFNGNPEILFKEFMQLLNEPCPGKTILSLDLILLISEVTSRLTLPLATSVKEFMTELILPDW